MHIHALSDPLFGTNSGAGCKTSKQISKKLEVPGYRAHLIKPKVEWTEWTCACRSGCKTPDWLLYCRIVRACNDAPASATVVQMKNEIEAAGLAVLKYPRAARLCHRHTEPIHIETMQKSRCDANLLANFPLTSSNFYNPSQLTEMSQKKCEVFLF